MPLFDLYPIETTSTLIEIKKHELVLSSQTTSALEKAASYDNFFIKNSRNLPHQSFTRVSINDNIGTVFIKAEINNTSQDYDLFIPLPIKKTLKVKGKLKSISKLQITPSLD